jgi:hypothetical protein
MNALKPQSIRLLVDQGSATIARCWPLRTFVYRNPLQGLEQLPFNEAVRQGERLFGGRGYLPNDAYRALARAGRISDWALREAVARAGLLDGFPPAIQIGPARVESLEVLRLHVLHGITEIDESLLQWMMADGRALRCYRHEVPAAVRREPAAEHLHALWRSILGAMGLAEPLIADERPTAPSSTPPDEAERRRGPWGAARVGRSRTVAAWLQELTGDNLIDTINDHMIRWCSAFLDEGMAVWAMPDRERGFYQAWRALAPYDHALRLSGITDAPGRVRRLPESPEEAIADCLTRLGLPARVWADYLSLHLAQLPGWAGLIKWRGTDPPSSRQQEQPIDLVHYLAVRLSYETELVEALCRRRWQIGGSLQAIEAHFRKQPTAFPAQLERSHGDRRPRAARDGWRLFHLAQFLGLTPEAVRSAERRALLQMLELLDRSPPDCHGPVWLDALERSYRERLLGALRGRHAREASATSSVSPLAQAVFCIDARSEPLRRHLEGLGEYETFGFAGFFGVPIRYRPYDAHDEQLLCPALITPQRVVVEVPRPDQGEAARRREVRSCWRHVGHGLFHSLKSNNLTAYVVIDLLGAFFGLSLMAKTLFPRAYQRFRRALDHRLHPPVATYPAIDQPDLDLAGAEAARFGFTLAEQAAFVENGLRMVGLTDRFARIVLLCAHGSASENNPYASAYDCGACGGHPGGPNARVLAAMANKPDVRAILRQRGIQIPEETLFCAGEHNTTTDRVVLFDEGRLPASHREEVARLAVALRDAGRRTAAERLARLPGAPATATPEAAAVHAERRSIDWSQVRPEWGLSGHGAFLIGRRTLSRGVNLEGRVFMHSYDASQDRTGAILETIMTAPLLVVQWISMEYFFSSVDPWTYGSGSKVLHNVVGGVGVMLGRHGDLRPGLPLQSVTDGNLPYHEPMRPLIVIDAPPARVEQIIAKHTVLQRLFNHQWLHLVVMEPSSGALQTYDPGDGWRAVSPVAARMP